MFRQWLLLHKRQPLIRCRVRAAFMDLSCFYRLPKRVRFVGQESLTVSFSMFKLFRPDFEATWLSVRELPLV